MLSEKLVGLRVKLMLVASLTVRVLIVNVAVGDLLPRHFSVVHLLLNKQLLKLWINIWFPNEI
jgi:hypothetical protein